MSRKPIGKKRILSLALAIAILLSVGLAPGIPFAAAADAALAVYGMQVEYKDSPVGVDVIPRLQWKLEGDGRGRAQTAYQIVVKKDVADATPVWDSGKVASDLQSVSYAGPALAAKTRYYWQVQVWDEAGAPSQLSAWDYWETGLNIANGATNQSNWPSGIQWIGMGSSDRIPAATLPANQHSGVIVDPSAVTTYRFEFDFRIPEGSDKFSLILGARSKFEYAAVEIDLNNGSPTVRVKYQAYRRSPSTNAGTGTLLTTAERTQVSGNQKNDKYVVTEYATQSLSTVVTAGHEHDTYRLRINASNTAVAGIVCTPDGTPGGSGASAPSRTLNITSRTLPDQAVSNQPRRWGMYNWGFDATGSAVEISNFELNNQGTRVFMKENFASQDSKLAALGTVVPGTPNKLLIEDSFDLTSNIGATALRREFEAPAANEKTIQYARLYATSRGIYDVFINGKRATDSWFNPGFNEYTMRQTYQSYDVTALVQPGANAIAAQVGKGWYGSNNTGYSGKNVFYTFNNASINNANGAYIGDFMAFVEVEYTDGTREVLVKTDNTWKSSDKTPTLNADMMDGEIYDARLEQDGWAEPGFVEDGSWVAAGVKNAPNYTDNITLRNNNTGSMFGATGGNHGIRFQLTSQITPPAVVEREIRAINLDNPTKTTDLPAYYTNYTIANATSRSGRTGLDGKVIEGYIYDFGINAVGVPELTVKGEAGTQIRFSFAEIAYYNGWPYNDNFRSANGQIVYTLKGDPEGETFAPRFTFQPGRYITLEFVGEIPEILDLKMLVLTNTPDTVGGYESSNDNLNQLQQNIQWGQRGNYIMVPTDCPQRNERMGWTGDTQVFASTAAYNMDVTAFLNSWLSTMRDSQMFYNQGGAVPDTIPLGGDNRGSQYGCPGWTDSGALVPWELYMATGDVQILIDSWPIIRDLGTYKASNASGGGRANASAIPGAPAGATGWVSAMPRRGDHLSLDPSTPWQLSGSAYAVYTVGAALKTAKILNALDPTMVTNAQVATFQEYYDNFLTGFRTAYMPDNDGSISYRGAASAQYAYWSSGRDGFGNTFASTTYNEKGEIATKPSQTAYALAIDFGIVPEDQMEAAGNFLVESVRRGCGTTTGPELQSAAGVANTGGWNLASVNSGEYNYPGANRITTGFLGVAHILSALVKTGHADVAYELLMSEEYPGWLYSVVNGSTTMWERWSSYQIRFDEQGNYIEDFCGPQDMNSFNHYSFGCVGDWMYNTSAGIALDRTDDVAGYKHTILRPTPGGGLDYASGWHISQFGKIESAWEIAKKVLTYDAAVPVNTTSTVYLPVVEAGAPVYEDNGAGAVLVTGAVGATVNDVTFVGYEGDKAVFEIGSGDYSFTTIAEFADKSGLATAMGACEQCSANEYTAESWKAAQDAYDAADAVNDDAYAWQYDVDAAADALNEAIGDLIGAVLDFGAGQPAALTLKRGQVYQIKISSNNKDEVLFFSANGNVSVSPTGLVTGVKPGIAVITVVDTWSGQFFNIVINVTN